MDKRVPSNLNWRLFSADDIHWECKSICQIQLMHNDYDDDDERTNGRTRMGRERLNDEMNASYNWQMV